MEVKEYCEKRKLEMVTESRELDRKYQGLLAQGKQLEALLNQTNELKRRLDIELDVLIKVEEAIYPEEPPKESAKC